MGAFEVFLSLSVIGGLLFLLIKQKYSYWKKLGVPFIEPEFPFGSLKGVGRDHHQSVIMTRLYHALKSLGTPFVGMYFFLSPVVLVTSLDFVKTILIKDSWNFIDRGQYFNEDDDPLSAHMFNVDNPKWKILRAKLSPTFTSGKMKMMFNTVRDVGEKFVTTLGVESGAALNNEVEIKDIAARYTTDVIGSCAFGLDMSSLEDPKSIFRAHGKKLFDDPKHSAAFIQLCLMFKGLAKKMHVTLFHKDSTDFFLKIVKETIEYRDKNNVKRKDFMHLLMQLMKTGSLEGESDAVGEKLTVEQVAAQAFMFFLAGFETSSTAMCYTLYELSQNQEVQDKARDEVRKVLSQHDGQFTYDAMMDMHYVDNCLSESLRKYPPVTHVNRSCMSDYKVEGTNFTIKKGQMVFIPVYAIQNDPEIFPNPEIFDPDRFTAAEEAKRSPYAYLPFGQGPRNCVGLRFGVMQAKIGIAMLLNNFKFEPCSRSDNPIIFEKKPFILTPKGGVYLKVTKI